jgi:hypothetical protein
VADLSAQDGHVKALRIWTLPWLSPSPFSSSPAAFSAQSAGPEKTAVCSIFRVLCGQVSDEAELFRIKAHQWRRDETVTRLEGAWSSRDP